MPMISAMMVMTTSNSTSVKPRWPRAAFRLPSSHVVTRRIALTDDLADGEQRCHHRHDQSADDDRDRDDRRRARDGDNAVERTLQLGLVKFGDPRGEHRQLSRFLSKT